MEMKLNLTAEETEMLERLADIENRSMQEIAHEAVSTSVEARLRRILLDRVLDEELPKWSGVLRRLGE
ncbi:MAG: hypothetical protein RLZZ426_897 [Actinomycetota bacterium]|jgi:hypothetical protein